MDWISVITGVIGLIGGGIGTRIVTIKSTKRKAGAEADSAAIEALKSAIAELREMQEESGAREDKLNAQIADRDAKIEKLHSELADKRCENTTKGYYMCVHQGCALRRPSLGRGKEYYSQHIGEDDFGADFLSVEELLDARRRKLEGGVPDFRPEMPSDDEGRGPMGHEDF